MHLTQKLLNLQDCFFHHKPDIQLFAVIINVIYFVTPGPFFYKKNFLDAPSGTI